MYIKCINNVHYKYMLCTLLIQSRVLGICPNKLGICITNAYLAHIENVVCRIDKTGENLLTINRENSIFFIENRRLKRKIKPYANLAQGFKYIFIIYFLLNHQIRITAHKRRLLLFQVILLLCCCDLSLS